MSEGPSPSPEIRCNALYRAHFRAVLGYVRRREASEADVADIVADVFAIAWRRIDSVPEAPGDLLWLYGVARRILSEHRRRRWRRGRLSDRIAVERIVELETIRDPQHDRLLVLIARLRPADQEVLRLVLWEELSHEAAAAVLGCSVNAVAVRIYRAKRRIAKELEISKPSEPPTDAVTFQSPDTQSSETWRATT
ncbi:MAG: sigma-70 family RNA polymerase sigma factor [Acidimicrobiales bacterium]|jgi:RNA polymerase sigma-70 factor (ECF subfamily)